MYAVPRFRSPALLLVACSALVAVGCGAAPEAGGEAIGQAEIQLTSVPTGVQCVQIVSAVSGPTGTQTSVSLFPVTAGASTASLTVNRLPLGSAAISGNAYNLACDDATLPTTQPTWISDTAEIDLVAGAVPKISLTFHPNQPVSISANFVPGVQAINRGDASYEALMSDGTVREWGYLPPNLNTTPISVSSLTGVAQVAGGLGFACARKTSGTVWCWGYNPRGQLGPNATTIADTAVYTTPLQVPLPDSAKEIAAGRDFACAIVGNNRTLYCWGDNSRGQFGNSSFPTAPVPTPTLARGDNIAHVYAGIYGHHACVIVSFSNSVECAGEDVYGEIGNGVSGGFSPTWAQVAGAWGITAMSLGDYHTCGLRADGLVRCWGYNFQGQLGDGTTSNASLPVNSLVTDAVAVAAGSTHTCAIRKNGKLACWGSLPTGTGVGNPIPSDVPGLSNVVEAQSSYDSACVKTADLTVSCWGRNDYGELGDGSFTWHFLPAPVTFK